MLRHLQAQSQFLKLFGAISVWGINLPFPLNIIEYEGKKKITKEI